MKVSPCFDCKRVKNPKECENKNCQVWRRWFIHRWESLRAGVRNQMEKTPQKVGVTVSGNTYAPPDQVRHYLRNDPCDTCVCARNFCSQPCQLKKNWEDARQEVFL